MTMVSPPVAPGLLGGVAIDEGATLDKASSENFTVASWLLPDGMREHLLAVYGFARAVDDLGDLAQGDRSRLLDEFAGELDAALAGRPARPILSKVAATLAATGADRSLLDRLVEANRQDQVVSRYATYEALVAYCDLSANPVGRLVLAVFGVHDDDAAGALSDRICTGLQLVEHWQDVAEDRRAGRIYLPKEDMDRFGVAEADLDAPAAPPALRRLVAFEVARARRLLVEGAPLARRVGGRPGLAVAGFVGGGLAQLEAIEAASYDVLAHQVKASKTAVAIRTLAVAVRPASRRVPKGSP